MLRSLLVSLILLGFYSGEALAQATGAEELQRAGEEAFAQEDWARATELFEALVRADPESGHGWLRLGSSLQAQGAYEESLEPLARAEALGFQLHSVHLRMARSHAALGNHRQSVDRLEQLAAMGFANPGAVRSFPEFESLVDRADYQSAVREMDRNANPCMNDPAYGRLAFWVGEWDVVLTGTDQAAGMNRIERVSRDCVLVEHWMNTGGRGGKSLTFYDAGRGTWRQLFVFDSGTVVDYDTGVLREDALVFTGVAMTPAGQESLRRMTLAPGSGGTVHQLIEASWDGGTTWSVAFDAQYRPRD